MNTIKTALVVVVLLAVGYGVWVILNKSPIPDTAEMSADQWSPPAVDIGVPPTSSFSQTPPETSLPEYNPHGSQFSGSSSQAPTFPTNPSGTALGPSTNTLQGDNTTTNLPQRDPLQTREVVPSAVGTTTESPVPPTTQGLGSPESNGDQNNTFSELQGTSRIDTANFNAAWDSAQSQLRNNRLEDALLTLSSQYDKRLNVDQRRRLIKLLDQLSGSVIYSDSYHIETPYVVRRGESLKDIAKVYNIPWQMLALINGIEDPDILLPSTKLKVIRGPFNAVISLTSKELTLMHNGSYAGRFPVSFGSDPAPLEGRYEISEKMLPGDHSNPTGETWLGLGGNLRIHSESNPSQNAAGRSIGVSPMDARDLYAILSQGSSVVIHK